MSKAASHNGLRQILSTSRPRPASCWQSLRVASLRRQWDLSIDYARALQTDAVQLNDVPFRKQLKEEAKRKRQAERDMRGNGQISRVKNGEKVSRLAQWQLTVGLEIHAQLNAERKLFSAAESADTDVPNVNVSVFDLAFPGSQPEFQKAMLIPAVRAALGLSCQVHRESRFDRKHYYYQDQPAGYQITQYYKPFATDGRLTLYDHDGIAPEDGKLVDIGIKQVQIEQDTAKTTLQPPSTALLDFNRVGQPLIEIITHPQIHHAQTASACVRKIQAILQAVYAVTTGMELGGLRADVNVSVRPKGIEGLGQRTEIKNLSSFKAVEDAIAAERDRQIALIESGGLVEGETRGWTLGSTETKKLRGKEGEVDYRYMPDPDIPPLTIGKVGLRPSREAGILLIDSSQDLIDHIARSMPDLPDNILEELITCSGLTTKDAKTLMSLDDGERLDYFDEVKLLWSKRRASSAEIDKVKKTSSSTSEDIGERVEDIKSGVANSSPVYDKVVANWVLHELGGLLSAAAIQFTPSLVPPGSLVEILSNLHENHITGTTAKQLLAMVFDGDNRDINVIIREENLVMQHLSREEYLTIAQALIGENGDKVRQIQQKGQMGKLKWFVGQMMRQREGKMEAAKAEAILKELLGIN